MYLVLSASLHPDSRSRILAQAALQKLESCGLDCRLIDLAQLELPFCDGDACYGEPNVGELANAVSEATGILIASPIYNYDVSATIKNAIELTGRAWTEKVVGFLVAAGGQGSYMSVMGLANSLMLDFRCLVLPRFVYATGEAFQGDQLADEIEQRIEQLVQQLSKIADANRSQ